MLSVLGRQFKTKRGVAAPTSATISGTVSDVAAAAVANATVRVLSGGVVVSTALTDGSGHYSFSVAAGTYTVDVHPPLTHSLGASETGSHSVSPGSGATVTQNFTVQVALYADTFQQYSASSQLQGTPSPIPSGHFWYHNGDTSYEMIAYSIGKGNAGSITLDPTGGPSGSQAMKYAIPANTSGLATGDPNTVYLGVRINPTPASMSEIAVRWTDMVSAAFTNAADSSVSSQREYKYFLLQLGPNGGNGLPQIGMYLEGDDAGGYSIVVDATDRASGNINTLHSTRYNLPAGWRANWHTWVLHATGLGSSSATIYLYFDGALVMTLTGSFLAGNGDLSGSGSTIFPNLGNQLNAGPQNAQSRWWREFGVYKSRPSLLPIV